MSRTMQATTQTMQTTTPLTVRMRRLQRLCARHPCSPLRLLPRWMRTCKSRMMTLQPPVSRHSTPVSLRLLHKQPPRPQTQSRRALMLLRQHRRPVHLSLLQSLRVHCPCARTPCFDRRKRLHCACSPRFLLCPRRSLCCRDRRSVESQRTQSERRLSSPQPMRVVLLKKRLPLPLLVLRLRRIHH